MMNIPAYMFRDPRIARFINEDPQNAPTSASVRAIAHALGSLPSSKRSQAEAHLARLRDNAAHAPLPPQLSPSLSTPVGRVHRSKRAITVDVHPEILDGMAKRTKLNSDGIFNDNHGTSETEVSRRLLPLPATQFGHTGTAPLLSQPISLGGLDVNQLFASLVATGLVPIKRIEEETSSDSDTPKSEEEASDQLIEASDRSEVDLLNGQTLKIKRPGVVAQLYGGMQCSSCGMRFPPRHSDRYSRHLDWHFRQNRRHRESARKAFSRPWNYSLPDWMQCQEEDPVKVKESRPSSRVVCASAAVLPSAPAGTSLHAACALCGDSFHVFFHDDEEEWHLRKAVSYRGQNFHPECCEDYKKSIAKGRDVVS